MQEARAAELRVGLRNEIKRGLKDPDAVAQPDAAKPNAEAGEPTVQTADEDVVSKGASPGSKEEAAPQEEKPKGDEAEPVKPVAQPEGAQGDSDAGKFDVMQDDDQRWSSRTRERVQELRNYAKTGERSQLAEMLRSTRSSGEELANLLETLRLINSGDAVLMERGFQNVERFRGQLAARLGREVPGVDLLSEFPDLKQKVESMELTREVGLELAQGRRAQRDAQTRDAQAREQTMRQQANTAEVQKAQADLNALGSELAKGDIDYEAKVKLLEEAGEIADIMSLPPAQWTAAFQRRYKLVTVTAARREAPAKQPQQPIRPNGAGGGSAPAIKSVRDAIRAGVREAHRDS